MPINMEQYQKSLAQPPLCEQLKVRDLTDDLLIQLNGSFVAGYRLSGIYSYYASDEERNRTKLALEALVRSLPERSMRLQARFEIVRTYVHIGGEAPSPVFRIFGNCRCDRVIFLRKDGE